MNNPTPFVLKQHCCTNCSKTWDCPQGEKCEMPIAILCSKCMNMSKLHTHENKSTPEFGEGKQV